MSKNKIKKIPISSTQLTNIRPSSLALEGLLRFSFKYYTENDKFSVKGQDAEYFLSLLNRLRDLSKWTYNEIVNSRSDSLRCHRITWEETTEKGFGIPSEEQLVGTPYQLFEVSLNKGRVHDFFVENTAYIVWLDPDHRLYGEKK